MSATPAQRPWFVGAWRRRSIQIPDGSPVEPCEAWWIQSDDIFVDIRVTQPGFEGNDLPYSQTRAFAGRFEIADGEVRWHLELDSLGLAPRTDRAPSGGLYISDDDPLLMIEDAPGRFRELWVNHAPNGSVEIEHTPNRVSVRVGDIYGVVETTGGAISSWASRGPLDTASRLADLGNPSVHDRHRFDE